MKYYIAVDGGGTKTETLLCTREGHIVRRRLDGPSNPNDIGLDAACALLCQAAGIGEGFAPAALFAGISGAIGNTAPLTRALAGRAATVRVGSDAQNLLSCAGPGDCACIIAGTGSVCFARRGEELRRIGGWGYLLDTGGSGYDIGRDALTAVLRACDGRGEATALTGLLTERLGIPAADAIPAIYREGKPFIASLSPIVFDAAKKGDKIAADILRRNAGALAELVCAASRWLYEDEYENEERDGETIPCRVLLGGSLLTARDELTSLLRRLVPPPIQLLRSDAPPVWGALVEAMLLADDFPTDEGALDTCRRHFLDDYAALTANSRA